MHCSVFFDEDFVNFTRLGEYVHHVFGVFKNDVGTVVCGKSVVGSEVYWKVEFSSEDKEGS